MQNYANYRKTFVEMSPAYDPDPAPEPASSFTQNQEKLKALEAELEKTVDDFIDDLKTKLTNPTTAPQAQQGLADRVKNWWANVWHGKYNQENPYFWSNSPGTKREHFSLDEYLVLRDASQQLESALPPGTERLTIIKTLEGWGAEFKQRIKQLFSKVSSIVTAHDFTSRMAQPMQEPETHSPTKGPVTIDEPKPTPPPAKPRMQQPPVKDWNMLSRIEQDAWNKYGGGEVNDVTKGITKAGIKTLPWILRKNDPRVPIIRELKAGYQWKWDRLVQGKRVEGENGVEIDDDPDKLAFAVATARKAKEDDLRNRVTTTGSAMKDYNVDARRKQKFPNVTLGNVELPPELTPQNKPEPPVTSPAELSHETPPQEEKPPESHTAKQGSLFDTGEEPKEPEKPSRADVLLKKLEARVNNGQLKEKYAHQYRKMIEDGKFDEVEEALDAWDENYDYADYMMQLPLKERVEFYRRMLAEQTWQNHRPVPNRRKARQLPYQERVQYFRDLLKD